MKSLALAPSWRSHVSGAKYLHLLALQHGGQNSWHRQQEALLLQRDRSTRYVSKFVLCFTRYGS